MNRWKHGLSLVEANGILGKQDFKKVLRPPYLEAFTIARAKGSGKAHGRRRLTIGGGEARNMTGAAG
jgi:hypothetical protein